MISKMRESRRNRSFKMTKNLLRLYRERKCSECSVVVTRMDFAKILGKFTKVKIQYESSSPPKAKKNNQLSSPNSNTRLKSNENGMVLIHRNAYNQHPVKELFNSNKKTKGKEMPMPTPRVMKENTKTNATATPRQVKNILKENNRLKKMPNIKEKPIISYNKNIINSNLKSYGIMFVDPSISKNNDIKNKLSLTDLLPCIDKSILPSDEWYMGYFPNNEEPKEDKVYDRIAAELEDLMYNEGPTVKSVDKADSTENKVDDFPSIMDILNDDSTEKTHKACNQNNSSELESSDVEAMLLGKSHETSKELGSMPMDVVNPDMSNLMDDVVQLNAVQNSDTKFQDVDVMDNPQSPSILDEALQKGIEEHLPVDQRIDSQFKITETAPITNTKDSDDKKDLNAKNKENICSITNINAVTHVVFKKSMNGKCFKSVTCPKNMKYSIEMEGKSVEFLGAPKFITNLEDLKVLLQIVNESELNSLYVLH